MQGTKELSKDFTKGNIPKQLLKFSLPFMASNALQVLYSTIDMIVVGKCVGTNGISAVSQASLIITFATMMCLGFSNAGQVLLGQAFGASKRKEMNDIIGTLFVFMGAVSILITTLILFGQNLILTLVNMPQESFEMARQYLVICGGGFIFTAGYNLVSAVLRGMGDSKRPFIFIGIASLVNLVLDILFTAVWGWGVVGAAWATIIGQAVSFIFSIFYLLKKKEKFGFDFKKESFKPNKKYLSMIVSVGTPMAVQSGFINISMLFVNSMVNDIGVVGSATFGVGVRIDDIVNKICMGIQYAAVPMISQNIGAREEKRVTKIVNCTWVYSIALTIFFMLLYVFFGKQLFMLFDDNVAVHEKSLEFIKAILFMFPAFALMRGSGALIQGIGHSKFGLVLSVLDGVVLRIGLSWLFGIVFGWGFFGFVLGYGLAPYGYAIPSTIYFLSGKWKKRKVLAEDI